jgi:hypothetical protein
VCTFPANYITLLAIPAGTICVFQKIKTGQKMVQTKTSVKTAKNPGLQSFTIPVWSFWLLGKGTPVMVMVKASQHQKTGLDQTFNHSLKSQFQQYQPAKCVYFRKIEI